MQTLKNVKRLIILITKIIMKLFLNIQITIQYYTNIWKRKFNLQKLIVLLAIANLLTEIFIFALIYIPNHWYAALIYEAFVS